jgi:hypothetical protein
MWARGVPGARPARGAAEGDRVLPVGRGKQSALLALLLLHPDHALSADRLIDELLGASGRRPPRARRCR